MAVPKNRLFGKYLVLPITCLRKNKVWDGNRGFIASTSLCIFVAHLDNTAATMD